MNRVLSFCLIVGVLVVGSVRGARAADDSSSSSSSPAASSDSFSASGPECIPDRAKKTLETCPSGPTLNGVHGKEPTMSFHSKVEEIKKGDKKIEVGKADVSMIAGYRDLRQTRLKQRVLALLITEIQQLETLLHETEMRSNDRPKLLRRLAEDYVELENAAFKEKTQAEIARDDFKTKKNLTEAGKQQAIANSRKTTMERARKAAINYYTVLVTDYAGQPSQDFPQNPPPANPSLDEIYYYLAYEYEQAGDTVNARRVYLDLITKTPNSKYLTNAYLAFGELFFNEALSDPTKWDAAKQAYQKVISKPPPENKIYGYAWYKLAYVFWNMGDLPHALDAFKRTIDFGVQFSQLPNATKLADSGRRDVVPVYALAGSPSESYNFFKNLSGDATGETAKTYKMMDDLGQNYLDTGHYPEAIALYKDLMTRDAGSDKGCEYQSRITEATMAMKSGDKTAIVSELNNQFKRFTAFKGESHAAEAQQRCANRTASLATETAMAWHLEAVGSQGQRGTGDPKTMDLAALLYKKVSDVWTAADFSKFEFPRLVKEDWPTIYKIKYNMADLLYYREKWAECGPAFDEVVKEDPQGADAAEAAYAAVLCYQNIYLAQHQKGADRKGSGNLPGVGKDIKRESDDKYRPKEMTDAQKAMIGSFNRYVCYIHPDAKDADGQKQLVEVKYARCRLYFEAQHWEEAGACFKEIAYDNADTDSAVYASQLYLESINVLTFHGSPNRNRCIDDMIVDVPKFLDLFCAGDKAAKNEDTCTILQKVQCDIRRLRAQRIVELADKGGNESLELFEKGGKAYFDLWDEYGAKPLRDNKPAQCEKLDEIVENAARAFQAGHLIASAIRARMILLNPTYRMEKTELAKQAMYKIGGNWQAIAVYDQAADWYERFAKENAHRENADKALSDAIVLRLGLGQEDQAVADVAEYRKDYANTNATETAQIAFAIGAHYADKEDWDNAKKALSGAMGTLDKAPPDIQVQAHATLARAMMHLPKGQAPAKAEYAKVRSLWGDGSQAQAKIHDAYKSEGEDQLAHKLGKAIDAVGEAMFYVAEDRKHDKVDAIPFPVYKGPGTKDDIKKYMDKTLMPWVQKKQAAIEDADKEYQHITELQPVPPPRWVIAAASRAGLMWGDFVDDFRRAPYPKDWDKKGFVPGTGDTLSWREVKANYLEHLDEASEPIKVSKAKPALRRCLDDSVKYQYFDEYSRDCEKWLAKNYKTEYHIVDELRGAPTLSNGGLDDKPPPLVVGGQLWHPAATGAATEKVEIAGENSDEAKKKPAGGKKKK
ncbi:MAG TPA: tetratricopeptide repeat protein [Polyangiaceae bacterium]|jgi:TolA-binding protein